MYTIIAKRQLSFKKFIKKLEQYRLVFYCVLFYIIFQVSLIAIFIGIKTQLTKNRIQQEVIIEQPIIVQHKMSDREKAEKILESVVHWKGYKKVFTLEEAQSLVYKIDFYAEKHGLSSELAFSIVDIESDFRYNATSHKNAVGLCQVTDVCLQEYNWNHGTEYSLLDMYNIDKNLEVGFWYFSRLINHYGSGFGITTWDEKSCARDTYIAYNYGITAFKQIGREGRNELRSGFFPQNGKNAGSHYAPIDRYNKKVEKWFITY